MFRKQKEFDSFKHFQKISGTRSLDPGCTIVCIIFSIIIIAYVWLGTWCSEYCFGVFDKTIPFFGNLVIGFFAGWASIPGAFILWILQNIGVI